MRPFYRTLLCDETGTTAIEYALIASLIAVIIAASVMTTGISVKNLFTSVVTAT
jgi:pilus assembly protein Flp/PilA